jgi:hypothetical protein
MLVNTSSKYNNVITICGSGRNVGKTFLGENIISHFSTNNDIIAIKISKFKHQNYSNESLKEIYKNPFYTIWQELAFSQKDSGRYLKAGAKLSFYVECDDAHLLESFLFVKNNFCKDCLIVCESASITKYIKPEISVFVQSLDLILPQNKIRSYQSSTFTFLSESIEISMPQLFLYIKNKQWVPKYLANCNTANNKYQTFN